MEFPHDIRLGELKPIIESARENPDQCRERLLDLAKEFRVDPFARCVVADCLARIGDSYTARHLYLQIFDDPMCPTSVMGDISEGLAFINEWSLAALVCQEWCQSTPDTAEPWYKLSYSLAMSSGEPSEIVHAAQQAVWLAPSRVDFRTGLAILLHAVGLNHEAYKLVAALDKLDLARVRCTCGLSHLQNIYEQARDTTRSEWCRALRGE